MLRVAYAALRAHTLNSYKRRTYSEGSMQPLLSPLPLPLRPPPTPPNLTFSTRVVYDDGHIPTNSRHLTHLYVYHQVNPAVAFQIQWQDNEHLLLSQLMSLAGGVADNGASPATWIEPDLQYVCMTCTTPSYADPPAPSPLLFLNTTNDSDGSTRRLAAPQAVNGCFVYTDKSDFESSFGQRANENSGLSVSTCSTSGPSPSSHLLLADSA